MKKLFTLFIAAFCALSVWAYDFQSGDLYYNITSNSKPYTVEVTSNSIYSPYSGDIVIPASVTYNGTTYAVTRIGDDAFNNDYGIESITIPKSVKSIGTWAFAGSYITSIVIPNSVEVIELGAFQNCRLLTSITLSDHLTSIGGWAFYGCDQLTSITIPKTIKEIGENAFGIGLSKTYYTGTIADWCKIQFADLSSNPAYTSRNLYINNEEVRDVVIPNTIDSISAYAFTNCLSITSVTIPSSITKFDTRTFRGCHSITSIVVQEGNTKYDSRNNCNAIIETASNTLIAATPATIIPNTVTTITSSAFTRCSALKAITIPNSVTSIGRYAFSDCIFTKDKFVNNSSLSAEENNYWGAKIVDEEINGLLIRNDTAIACRPNITSVTIPNGLKGGITYNLFRECHSLTSMIWDVKHYSDSVSEPFYGTKINSITFGNNVEYIPANICGSMHSLKNVIISDNVTEIGDRAFRSCHALTSVTIPKSVSNIGKAAFSWCNELTSVVWYPESCKGWYNEEGAWPLFNMCNKLSSIVFGDQVKEIPVVICYNLPALSSVVIPKNVTLIEQMAFYDCNSLANIYCYAETRPAIWTNAFNNYNATLHVPCDLIEQYEAHSVWTEFTKIKCINAENVETDNVVIQPSINDAVIIWPASANAETYTIIIKTGNETHSTLTFDAEGQLLGISYAPSRDGLTPARYAEETGMGFKFTVTGLDDGVEYTYEIIVKDAQNDEIESYTGTFTTQRNTSTDLENTNSQSPMTDCQKFLRNGQLVIVRDGKTYNAMGVEM